jgi:hypothetical protein
MPETPSQSRAAREVEIRLPDGRRVRARIAPSLARGRDLRRLQRSQETLAKRITNLESRADAAVANLAEGLSNLKRRARALAPAQMLQQQIENAKQAALQTQMRGVTSVVNTLQATAYGDKGTLLSKNNLLLAGSQLFWTLLDPVLQTTGLVTAQTATILSAIAPIGTLVTGGVLVADRQHERFISGETEVKLSAGFGRSSESLDGKIPDDVRETFRAKPNAPAMAVAPSGFFAFAQVHQGILDIEVGRLLFPGEEGGGEQLPDSVRVTWTVDTGADVG